VLFNSITRVCSGSATGLCATGPLAGGFAFGGGGGGCLGYRHDPGSQVPRWAGPPRNAYQHTMVWRMLCRRTRRCGRTALTGTLPATLPAVPAPDSTSSASRRVARTRPTGRKRRDAPVSIGRSAKQHGVRVLHARLQAGNPPNAAFVKARRRRIRSNPKKSMHLRSVRKYAVRQQPVLNVSAFYYKYEGLQVSRSRITRRSTATWTPTSRVEQKRLFRRVPAQPEHHFTTGIWIPPWTILRSRPARSGRRPSGFDYAEEHRCRFVDASATSLRRRAHARIHSARRCAVRRQRESGVGGCARYARTV
jgi:hypothetical protein